MGIMSGTSLTRPDPVNRKVVGRPAKDPGGEELTLLEGRNCREDGSSILPPVMFPVNGPTANEPSTGV